MKKNIMMRLSALLLVAVLLTTCVISGTFAKYVTTYSAKDVAQVAKWGVVVETKLDDLFETAYDDATGTVQAADTYNILAPGTTDGQVEAFKISGTPEVAVNVNVDVDVTLTNWKLKDDSVYCPLVISVNGTKYQIDATNTTTAKLEEAVEEAIKTALGHGNHNAKTNLNKTVDIAWEWPFSTSDANDKNDTYLGDQAEAGNAPTFGLDIKVTVTQVD